MKSFTIGGSRYTCEVTDADYSDNSTHILSASGTHLDSRTNQNVTMVFWSIFTALSEIPKGFSSVFGGLQGFQYENTLITELIGDELEEYSINSINWFSLTSSNLTRIPGDFFNRSNLLFYAGFSNNKITRVGAGLLDPLLTNGGVADFSNNPCVNMRASNSAQIAELKALLLNDCADVEPTTTDIEPSSSPTTSFDGDTPTSTDTSLDTTTNEQTSNQPSTSTDVPTTSTVRTTTNSGEMNKFRSLILMSGIMCIYLIL